MTITEALGCHIHTFTYIYGSRQRQVPFVPRSFFLGASCVYHISTPPTPEGARSGHKWRLKCII
jgi:hypothetical protein